MRLTYTLNKAEQKLARYLAAERHAMNRRAGAGNRRVGPQSDEQTDLEGIAAEIAFCRVMNVYPDTSLDGRPAYDAQIGLRRVDVKATTYQNGKLIAVPWKAENPPDAYALVVGTFPEYRVAGWLPADRLLVHERLTDLGHGPTYAAEQSELEHPGDL